MKVRPNRSANSAEAEARRAARAALIPPIAAVVAATIALVNLFRRMHEAAVFHPELVPPVMVPASSLAVIVAAGALLLVCRPGGATRRVLGRVIAVVTILLGIGVELRYLAEPLTFNAWWTLRPGPATGLALIFLGVALFAVGRRSPRGQRWADGAAVATLVVSLTALFGHVYDVSLLYAQTYTGGTAAPTAVALVALAVGALFADPSHGFAALAVSSGPGGHLVRRLLPVALLAPPVLGWLAVAVHVREVVDAGFAMAIMSVLLVLLFAGFIVRQAAVLHAINADREKLIAREQHAREQVTNILESITEGFFAVDHAWRFTYVNREAERLLQKPREELLGRNVWNEFPQSIGAKFQREYERAIAEQTRVQFEEYYPDLDTWFEVHAFPSVDGLSVFFEDVTARKRIEQRIQESEARYRLLADMIPQHIWSTDAKGDAFYFSRRWHEFTGATLEETKGHRWLELVHPDDQARAVARWNQALRTGEPYSIEYRLRRSDGAYDWFLAQAVPMRDEAGELVQWFGTLTDISARKQLEEEREQLLELERAAREEADRQREALERMTESRAGLMRGFSHDVKNSLNAGYVSAELLERGRGGVLTQKQRDCLHRIRRSIRTSLRLIDDLLELARAEAGQLELEWVDTDVERIARELAEDFRAQALQVGLSIDVHAPAGLHAVTDPHRLRQVLANLLSNAVKYASPGPVTVVAESRRSGGPAPGEWIVVSVTDSGPGIPADKREVIFEEYVRLDPKASHGAGIGLAISRRIARLMGGELTLDSDVGRGSTFSLWLPPRGHDSRALPPRGAEPEPLLH